jgi:hypothetical protein
MIQLKCVDYPFIHEDMMYIKASNKKLNPESREKDLLK